MNNRNSMPLVNVRRFALPTPWWVVVLLLGPVAGWWIARRLVRLVPVAVRNARSLLVVCAALYVWARWGWLVLVLLIAGLVGLAGLWWWRHRSSCERWLLFPLLAWVRRLFVYRWHWRHVMTACRLAEKFDGTPVLPQLLRVRCTHAVDEVTVRIPRGHTPDAYHKAGQALAHAFNYRQCRVFSTRRTTPPRRVGRCGWLLRAVDRVRFRDRPRLVWLVFVRRDPLTRTVPPFPVPAVPDLEALPMGLREDGLIYTLRLLANHVLVVGATRAGKGSVIWSLIRALAAGVACGLVQLWMLDPKGGMEMYMGRPLYTRYEDSDFEAMAQLLDDAIAVMRARQSRLRGVVRAHTPSTAEPLIVIVIDELACLVAYLPDGDLKKRLTSSLSLVLTQGAGLGVLVVAATQEPRKEVLSMRALFTTRIGLRLNESGDVDMSLGEGARDRGALCDQIPNVLGTRGIAFVVVDDFPEPARVRLSYVDDDDIRAMAARYQPAAAPVLVDDDPAPAFADPVPLRPRQHDRRGRDRGGRGRRAPSGPLLPERFANLFGGEE